MSYNSSGWGTHTSTFIQSILLAHSIDIIAIQEHWLLDKNLYKLNVLSGYDVFAIPARKSNSEINKGRPSGGIAFAVSNKLCHVTKRIVCPNSIGHRVQAIEVCLNAEKFVLINCYFPVDPQRSNMDPTLVLQCLQDVNFIIDLYNNDVNFILMGDLNTDFSRNSVFVDLVKSFLMDNNLQSVWNNFSCDYTFSFTKLINGLNRTYFSVIDHFCISNDLLNNVIEAAPLYSPDNTSNHSPIYLKIKCNSSNLSRDDNCNNQNTLIIPKPMWNRATESDVNNYVNHLERLMHDITIPYAAIHCENLHCNDGQHTVDIDTYALHVMDAISVATEVNIPHSTPGLNRKTPVPGWGDFVKPFREDSLFWHSVWISAGRPQNTVLHNIMRSTRNKYHYAIRKVRQQESEIRKNKMLQDFLDGNVTNILRDLKNKRKSKSQPINHIDGISGTENISSHFKDMYNDIFNRHRSSDRLDGMLHDLNGKIVPGDITALDSITDRLMKSIILKLDSNKSDESYSWGTDALKIGASVIASHLKHLFKAFIIHGHISQLFVCCALIPIMKNAKSSKFTSDNYRLIGISSLMLKLLDYIILELFGDNFVSGNLQFGFQKQSSCSMCTWMLLETINYFTNRGSPMYVCLLDLSKAFDSIKHDLLFEKLMSKVPPLFLRLIIFTYVHQTVYVRWSGVRSNSFTVSNGVRQGAVASPIFFNAYLDDLFIVLEKSGLGCFINDMYYGLLGYADDCALLSPSLEALQKMLIICQDYFDSHGIRISVSDNLSKSKTKCLAFNINVVPANILLYNKPLPWVDSYKHLGHLVHKDENMSHDILSKRGEFISNVHALRQELGSQHPVIFMKLVQIYLSSMYGSNLWDLYSDAARSVFISWNVCIREAFNLPYATHRYILQDISEIPHIRVSLLRRFVKFYFQLKQSSKPSVRNLFRIQKNDVRSTFGRNCQKLCSEMQVSRVENINVSEISMPIKTPETETWRVPFILDLLNPINEISSGERDMLVNYICRT